jgi:hypothetical protein
MEKGKTVISDVDSIHWYSEGVYEYEKNGKYTLIEKGETLISDVDWVHWFSEGVYEYEKDGKTYKINC